MAKRDLSGRSDEALTIPATDCRELISGADFDGELATFHLLGIIIYNSDGAADAVVDIYDQDEGVAVAANQQFTIVAPFGVTTIVSLDAPGWQFHTNITAATTGGTIAAYEAGAWGYLEGGM